MGVGLSHPWISARVPRQTTCNIFLNDEHAHVTQMLLLKRKVWAWKWLRVPSECVRHSFTVKWGERLTLWD